MKKWICAFIVFFASVEISMSQTLPGGVVTGLKLWVQSGSGITNTGGLVDAWQYVNDATKSFISGGVERPALVNSGLNFNPVLRLASGQILSGPVGADAPLLAGDDDYTVFAVWQSNSVTAFQRIWLQASPGVAGDAVSLATWNDGRYGDEIGTPPFDHTVTRTYSLGEWNITQLNVKNQATSDLEIIDNRNISTGITTLNTDPSGIDGAALRNLSDQLNNIGAKQFGSQQPLNGDIAEIIVYDRELNGVDRNKIFSYLALKYGISVKTNLTSSLGTTVWDASSNSIYNNAVFGLGLDNLSGLSVIQSNNLDNGSGNGTGQSGKGNIVLSNPSSLTTDNNFLIIGNNSGTLTESGTEIPASASGSLRLAREWKVQHTGNVGTVSLSIDLNGLLVTGMNSSDFRLMIDENGNGDFTEGTIRYYTPSSYTGSVVSFANVVLNNGEVFSLITSASGVLPVTWKSFTALPANGGIRLNWEVENNENARSYEIEHSTDGINFTKIAVISNKTEIKAYSYLYSSSVTGNHYFRIHQFDINGKSVYSKIILTTIQSLDYSVRLLSNPLRNNNAEIEVQALKRTNALIEVWSMAGARVLSQNHAISIGNNKLNINMSSVLPGSYILKVKAGDFTMNEKILKL